MYVYSIQENSSKGLSFLVWNIFIEHRINRHIRLHTSQAYSAEQAFWLLQSLWRMSQDSARQCFDAENPWKGSPHLWCKPKRMAKLKNPHRRYWVRLPLLRYRTSQQLVAEPKNPWRRTDQGIQRCYYAINCSIGGPNPPRRYCEWSLFPEWTLIIRGKSHNSWRRTVQGFQRYFWSTGGFRFKRHHVGESDSSIKL